MSLCGAKERVLGLALVALVLGCEIKTVPNPATSNNSEKPVAKDTDGTVVLQQASETISAEGSSTVYPICQAFAVEFEKKSHHKVSVGSTGTGSGYKKFVNRQADIWNASRPIDEKEAEVLNSKGIEWLELTVAVDGIVNCVNPENDWCSNITCGQLKKIWEPDSKIRTWKDLDSTWPDEKIMLFGADTDSGTFEYFTEMINGKKKATNANYTPAANDNILVTGIASNKYALGYIPFGYYVENTEKLKVLNVSAEKNDSNSGKFVTPTEETILSGEYAPLSRPLFMYINKHSLLERPEVAEFVAFAISEAAQPLIQQRQLVRVKDEVREEMEKRLAVALSQSTTAGK